MLWDWEGSDNFILNLIRTKTCRLFFIQMHKCCTLNQTHRPQRRIHGLQLPLNYLQILGWIVFVTTCILNFAVVVQIQVSKVKLIAQIIFVILYTSHLVSHMTATLLDPSEKDLRKMKIDTVPEFDRNIHAHVIENGRCHICNIYTSSKKTKHCSLCNKCVDRFDHHCKWLNSCVGNRNYRAFIASVTTALLLSLMTTLLCLASIVLFLTDTQQLSPVTQDILNCSITVNYTDISQQQDETKFCRKSIMFLMFLVIIGLYAIAVACALVHLFCFHIYISILGVSTYEYIVRSGSSIAEANQCKKGNCSSCKLPGKLYVISKPKTSNSKSEDIQTKIESEDINMRDTDAPVNGERNVANFIGILVNNELDKAKRIFLGDKNKIHPQEEIS